MIVSVKNSDPEADKVKEFLAKDGKNVISKQLDKYVVALKEGKKCLLVIDFNLELKYYNLLREFITLHVIYVLITNKCTSLLHI